VAAMAMQTALVEMTGAPFPATGLMTTTGARLMLSLGALVIGGDRSTSGKASCHLMHTYPVVIGFGAGCALGAKAQHLIGAWALCVPMGLTLAAIGISLVPDQYRMIERAS